MSGAALNNSVLYTAPSKATNVTESSFLIHPGARRASLRSARQAQEVFRYFRCKHISTLASALQLRNSVHRRMRRRNTTTVCIRMSLGSPRSLGAYRQYCARARAHRAYVRPY